MKKTKIILAIVGTFSLIAIFTNPTQEMHKERVKEKLNSYLQSSLTKNFYEAEDELDKLGYLLGDRLGSSITKHAVNELVVRKNYILFSTTNITWAGNIYPIGIGAFGNVFLSKNIDDYYDGLLNNFDYKN